MKRIVLAILCFTLFGCISDSNEEVYNYERAQDPWVFRSVLDKKARMVTVGLHDNLWMAYSAENGSLYKAWKGGVNFDGAVYTTVHGPQPSTLGDAYFENAFEKPWLFKRGEQAMDYTIQYRGHQFKKGQVELQIDLQLEDGNTVRFTEKPEYVTNELEQVGLERVFALENLPDGITAQYQFNISSIALESSIQTDATLEFANKKDRSAKGLKGIDADVLLTLNPKGETTITTFFTKKPLLENDNKVVGAEEEEERPLGYRLIARNDCKTCHNTYVKTIGPAYVEVARRYRNNPENVAMLVSKVHKGGSGVWGEAAMNAHPEIDVLDIQSMVEYIMTLDEEEEALLPPEGTEVKKDFNFTAADSSLADGDLSPGLLVKIFKKANIQKIADFNKDKNPIYEGILGNINIVSSEFKGLEENFGMIYTGYLEIPKDNNYVFRLVSDDGSRLTIGETVVVDHDGLHGAGPKDGEMALKAGLHPIKVEYFQGLGGKTIQLGWKSFDDAQFSIIPTTSFKHSNQQTPKAGAKAPPMAVNVTIPGDGYPLKEVHPSYDLTQARPSTFLPKVGGMDFLSDGRMVISTWDAEGGVYILDGVETGDTNKITTKKIANGLAEPLGLKVVDDEIYVLQKQELTKLVDHNGDEIIDEYYTVCNAWQVSANFHEFAFGLVYKDGYFYATLAISIEPGGASTNPQISDRGKAVQINKETGAIQYYAEGLRTPNGIGIGADNEIFIADNQGDWLPSSKILHLSEGAFFGSRAVDSARVAELPVKQPVAWLPQDEIGNSPTTPSYLNDGPYKGQMIHGEVTNGGVKRVFVENVGGNYQGCVFRFIQGLEAGVNRLVWGPDDALYVGGVGSTGNWRHEGGLWYGLQRLKYNQKPAFEMLAVRAKSDGMEIELTEPLEPGAGWDPSTYNVQQWFYLPTSNYGGPKMDLEKLNVLSANISEDRRKIFLELEGMKPQHVVYIQLPNNWVSENSNEIWTTEAWYTLNEIPTDQAGFKTDRPELSADNTLSPEEIAAGWELLFDGTTTNGWRNFKEEAIGPAWKVQDGTLMLDGSKREKGANGYMMIPGGGNIITEKQYDNFELRLEWKISACGNSGIMYLVSEDDAFDHPWQSGPEMQILDNVCHPDSRYVTHKAGDLYDMIECKYLAVKPAGEWNEVRIVINDGKLEHWLNGRKVVATTLWTDSWNEMIANSKFKDMKGFGQERKGHICLQDHSDTVWFKNLKIKPLK